MANLFVMKSKIFLTVICLMLFSLAMSGQKKTYQGPYRIAWGITGNVDYEYVEVDYERIKDGKFIFNNQENGNPAAYKIAISGSYKNGLKDGHWKSVITGRESRGGYLVEFKPDKSNAAMIRDGATTQVEGQYVSDVKEGKWVFSQAGSGSRYNSTAYFKNGKFIGEFIATRKIENRFYELKGQFVENGLPDSTWVVKWNDADGIDYVLKMEFSKGQFRSLKVVDLSSGENITSRYENYTYVSGCYAGDNWGVKAYWAGALPVIELLVEPWLWDETLSTEKNNGKMTYMYLDWNRD